MSSSDENHTSNDSNPIHDDNDKPNPENSQSTGHTGTNETDTTAIENGPYGDVAILTIDGDFLRSLGFNPDHIDKIRYRPYNGAVLVEPVTQ